MDPNTKLPHTRTQKWNPQFVETPIERLDPLGRAGKVRSPTRRATCNVFGDFSPRLDHDGG